MRKRRLAVLPNASDMLHSELIKAMRARRLRWQVKREFKFCLDRRWKFDFALPRLMVAVEIEGYGRHQTMMGYAKDCGKYNIAQSIGWKVYRYPADVVRRNSAGVAEEVMQFCFNVKLSESLAERRRS